MALSWLPARSRGSSSDLASIRRYPPGHDPLVQGEETRALPVPAEEHYMTKSVTYTTKVLTAWNEKRQGEIELDAPTRAYLGDAEITDRDCIAFALRELRKRDTTSRNPIDWTKPLLICSVVDSEWGPSASRGLPNSIFGSIVSRGGYVSSMKMMPPASSRTSTPSARAFRSK
jgi:hypothetical protein